MIRRLPRPDIPLLPTGGVMLFEGDNWRAELRNRHKKAAFTFPTEKIIAIGNNDHVLGPDEFINPVKLESILEPTKWETVFQVRPAFPDNSLVWWIKYLEGQFRGGLEKGGFTEPDLTDPINTFLAAYGYADSPWEAPLLETFYTYGKFPAFAVKNVGPGYAKARIRMVINEIYIKDLDADEQALVDAGQVEVLKVYSEEKLRW